MAADLYNFRKYVFVDKMHLFQVFTVRLLQNYGGK